MRTPVRFMKRKSKAAERGGHSKRYVRKRIDNKSNKKIGISALICGALAIAGFCGGILPAH